MASGGDVSVPAAVTSPIFSSAGIRVGFDSCPPENTYALDVPFRWASCLKASGHSSDCAVFCRPKGRKKEAVFPSTLRKEISGVLSSRRVRDGAVDTAFEWSCA